MKCHSSSEKEEISQILWIKEGSGKKMAFELSLLSLCTCGDGVREKEEQKERNCVICRDVDGSRVSHTE